MNIFGVGGPELIAILIIMLVFAGPKRMIHWAYILGQYVAKFRVIWSQTVDLVQQEFDDAGVDIKIPKDLPTRQNLNKSVATAFKPMSQPIQDSLDEVKKDMDSVKSIGDELKNQKVSVMSKKKEETPTPTSKPQTSSTSMGTWGGGEPASKPTSSPENKRADMGTWSSPTTDK